MGMVKNWVGDFSPSLMFILDYEKGIIICNNFCSIKCNLL